MKIVINRCFGGFGLSHAGVMEYARLSKFELYAFVESRRADGSLDLKNYIPYDGTTRAFVVHYSKKPLRNGKCDDKAYFSDRDIERTDPNLVKVVENLGKSANGCHANLSIVEIPDGVQYEIDEYDGVEHVAEVHRTWR